MHEYDLLAEAIAKPYLLILPSTRELCIQVFHALDNQTRKTHVRPADNSSRYLRTEAPAYPLPAALSNPLSFPKIYLYNPHSPDSRPKSILQRSLRLFGRLNNDVWVKMQSFTDQQSRRTLSQTSEAMFNFVNKNVAATQRVTTSSLRGENEKPRFDYLSAEVMAKQTDWVIRGRGHRLTHPPPDDVEQLRTETMQMLRRMTELSHFGRICGIVMHEAASDQLLSLPQRR